jgi:hypothetical protein
MEKKRKECLSKLYPKPLTLTAIKGKAGQKFGGLLEVRILDHLHRRMHIPIWDANGDGRDAPLLLEDRVGISARPAGIYLHLKRDF